MAKGWKEALDGLRVRQVKERVSILLKEREKNNYRIYLMGLGFLAYQRDIDLTTFAASDARNTLSGAFFESYVANELQANGFPLFCWKGKGGANSSSSSKARARSSPSMSRRKAAT